MERKNLLFLSWSLVITSAFFVASCSSDDDFLMEKDLDINTQVPLTRSEGGDGGPADIPKVDDQCGTRAATEAAYNKEIKRPTGNKKKDGSPEYARVGSDKYSCTRFYKEFNEIHENNYWPRCDKYGNEISTGDDAGKTDKGTKKGIVPSALREIGKEMGVFEGVQLYCDNYEELSAQISSISRTHEAGTYVIQDRRKQHYYTCRGIEKYGDHKGQVIVKDAKGTDYISKENDPKESGPKIEDDSGDGPKKVNPDKEGANDRGYVIIY